MRALLFTIAIIAVLTGYSTKTHAVVRISYFYDGDTVKIKDGQKEYKLRISHIDAPERNQTYGKKSRRALIKLCKDTNVEVTITGTDKYQRQLGNLYCGQQDAANYMLKNGHAWFNSRFSNNKTLAQQEQYAREHQLGLWAEEKIMPPWVWRKLVQNRQSTSTNTTQSNKTR